MDVLNMNPHPVTVKLKTPEGQADYAHVAPKRRVTLPPGFTVDTNWLAVQPKVMTYEDHKSGTPIPLQMAPIPRVAAPAPVEQPIPGVTIPPAVVTGTGTGTANADTTTDNQKS